MQSALPLLGSVGMIGLIIWAINADNKERANSTTVNVVSRQTDEIALDIDDQPLEVAS